MLRNLGRTAILLSLCVVFAGAHRSPPDFAYDHTASFAGLKSYAWFDDPMWVMPDGNAIVDGPFIDRNVRAAVDASLSKKGFAKVEKDPTFYVAYHDGDAGGLSQDKWGVYSWETGFSLGEEWHPRAGSDTVTLPPGEEPFAVDTGTKYRRKSTLVLDIRDSQKKLIWRGARTAMMGANPRELTRGIDHAVARLLAKFPPKEGSKAK